MIPALRKPVHLYALVAGLARLSSAAIGTLIPQHTPGVYDEFSDLLAGQTFAQFRLTNPTPPLWEFSESHHALTVPTMMSKYPPGQGLALAVGNCLGNPISGAWLAMSSAPSSH